MLNKFLITIAAVILAALLSVVPASAKIVGISVPNRPVHPGDHFPVTFHTSNWIINVEAYYVVFGIEAEPATNGGLGQLLGNGYDLVAHGHGSGPSSFDVVLQIPKSLKLPHNKAKYRLTAAILITVRAILCVVEEASDSLLLLLCAGWCRQRGIGERIHDRHYHQSPLILSRIRLFATALPCFHIISDHL